MSTTLILSTLGSLAASVLYVYIGTVLRRRKVSDDVRLANTMFVVWWMALGGLGILSAALTTLYMLDLLPIWFYQAYVSLVLMDLFIALWGLQFYLVFLYTGSRRSFWPLSAFYGLLFFGCLALLAWVGPPDRITDNGFALQPEPETDFGPVFSIVFLLLIVGPQMMAAILYARLFRKTSDRTQRYRIAMVTTAILVWFGSSLVATALAANESLAWQLLSRLIGVAAALGILFAYKPPGWVRAKYQVHAIESDARPS